MLLLLLLLLASGGSSRLIGGSRPLRGPALGVIDWLSAIVAILTPRSTSCNSVDCLSSSCNPANTLHSSSHIQQFSEYSEKNKTSIWVIYHIAKWLSQRVQRHDLGHFWSSRLHNLWNRLPKSVHVTQLCTLSVIGAVPWWNQLAHKVWLPMSVL